MTTGSEGKKLPTGRPVFCHVYTGGCPKSGWQRQAAVVDEKQAEEVVKAHKGQRTRVEVVNDYAPKEMYSIHGGGCSRSIRLLGTYVTLEEAMQAAREIRTVQKLAHCHVVSGTKAEGYYSLGAPAQYNVYVAGCKGGWRLATTTKDAKKAEEAVNEQKKNDTPVELVRHYASK